MNWREWIMEGHKKHPDPEFVSTTRYLFKDGASPERIDRLSQELGLPLPSALRELLLQSDGVDMEMYCNDEWFVFLEVVASCDVIADRNRTLRTRDDPPSPPNETVTPLYFAHPGVDGIELAFLVLRTGCEDPGVYAYYPIEREWRLVSPSLAANMLECIL